MAAYTGSRSTYFNVRLVADPKPFTSGENELVEIRFADNPPGEKYETMFISAVLSGKRAESAKLLKKGDNISIDGALRMRMFKDKAQFELPFVDTFLVHTDTRERVAAAPAPSATKPAVANGNPTRPARKPKPAAPVQAADLDDPWADAPDA